VSTALAPDEAPTGGLAGQVRRGLAWSTVSNVVLRLGNLAFGALMARLIAPNEFGVFAVALTVWMILGAFAEFGLGSDLVRRADHERYVPTVATLGLALSGTLALIMYALARPLAIGFGSPGATPVIQLMSVPLAMIGLSVVPAALLQRQLKQGTVFAIDTTALVVSTGFMVAFAMGGAGPIALALGRMSGQVVTVVLQYAAQKRLPTFG
jgi:PST family polysaccharide transporter